MAEASGVSGAGYAQAILGVADLLSGASKRAAYEAAYGKVYASRTQMFNAANAKVAAEANIAAITQDKINTDLIIQMKQREAEAQAQVMAAVSGATGQSVDAVIYQTETNSSLAKRNNKKAMENNIEQQLASIYSSQSTMLAADNPQLDRVSVGMNLFESAAQFAVTDGGAFMDGVDGLFAKSGGGDTGIMAMNYQLPTPGGTMTS